MASRRPIRLPLLALLLASPLAGLCSCAGGSPPQLLVAVASSLRTAWPELEARFRATQGGGGIAVSFGGSQTLRAQVEGGAPIDAVVFAAPEPVDRLIASGLVDPDTRLVFATNELVLIGSAASPALRFDTLTQAPPGERIAIGDPDAAPVGAYTRELLRRLGSWDALRERLVYGGHVAAVLAYVRRGEAVAGVVYRTDALGAPDVVVLDRAPARLAPRAELVAAVVRASSEPARARRLLEFLGSAEAAAILTRHGFGPPPQE